MVSFMGWMKRSAYRVVGRFGRSRRLAAEAAAKAFSELTEVLRSVEEQADALATGRFDDPSLTKRPTGSLGQSLQHAVTKLSNSMTEERDSRRSLEHAITHDPLTGLLNRSGLIREFGPLNAARYASDRRTFDQSVADLELDAERRETDADRRLSPKVPIAPLRYSSTHAAVLFIDLDAFKTVNDSYGHSVGDELLTLAADRIRYLIGPEELACRLGGDEFVVVLRSNPADAVLRAQMIVDSLAQPFALSKGRADLGASVGVAVGEPNQVEALLVAADRAVYQAKAEGKGRVVLDELPLPLTPAGAQIRWHDEHQ
jgi:diguanylate cyclase (GGDEF)-like protein